MKVGWGVPFRTIENRCVAAHPQVGETEPPPRQQGGRGPTPPLEVALPSCLGTAGLWAARPSELSRCDSISEWSQDRPGGARAEHEQNRAGRRGHPALARPLRPTWWGLQEVKASVRVLGEGRGERTDLQGHLRPLLGPPTEPRLPGEEVACKVLGQAGRLGMRHLGRPCWSQQPRGLCLGRWNLCSRWGLPEVGGHRVTGPGGLGVRQGAAGGEGTPAHIPGSVAACLLGCPSGLGCPEPWRGLLGVPLRPREAGEKAGGSRVQAAHSPAVGRPSSRAPGGPQRWAVLREAEVAQVQAGGRPGLATPPPSTAAGAGPPPAVAASREKEAESGGQQGRTTPTGHPGPRTSHMALGSCVLLLPPPQGPQLQDVAAAPQGLQPAGTPYSRSPGGP